MSSSSASEWYTRRLDARKSLQHMQSSAKQSTGSPCGRNSAYCRALMSLPRLVAANEDPGVLQSLHNAVESIPGARSVSYLW